MSVGKVLLKPQIIQNASGSKIHQLDLVTNFLSRIYKVLADDKKALEIIDTELAAVLDHFISSNKFFLDNALNHLLGFVTPCINFLKNTTRAIETANTVDVGKILLDKLNEVLNKLTRAEMDKAINRLFEIIENDLDELFHNIPDQVIHPTVDRVVQRLCEDYYNGANDESARIRFLLGNDLDRLRREILENLPVADFSVANLKSVLLQHLDKMNYQEIIEKISKIARDCKTVTELLQTLVELILPADRSLTTNARENSLLRQIKDTVIASFESIPAKERPDPDQDEDTAEEPIEYLWYASWLYNSSSRWDQWVKHWFVTTDVWKKGDKIFLGDVRLLLSANASFAVSLNNAEMPRGLRDEFTKKDISLSGSDNLKIDVAEEGRMWIVADTGKDEKYTIFNESGQLNIYNGRVYRANHWQDIEPFQQYTFKEYSPETMEQVAFHLGWIEHLCKCVPFIALSLVQRKYASNWTQVAINFTYSALKLMGPKGIDWLPGTIPIPNFWWNWTVQSLLPYLATTVASIGEDIYTDEDSGHAFVHWLITLLGPDLLELVLFSNWSSMVRDVILSGLTLYNYDGPINAPSGTEDSRPLNRERIEGVAMGMTELGVWLLPLLFPKKDFGFPNDNHGDKWWIYIGHMFGFGALFGAATGFLGTLIAQTVCWCTDNKAMGWTILKSITVTWLKYLPYLYVVRDGQTDDGKFDGQNTTYSGYQPKDNSPYLLPYAKGETYRCAQGNLGIWSHTPHSFESQIYAYDFAMDKGDEILAARAGIVDDFDDQNSDHSKGSWNYIRIKHQVPARFNIDLSFQSDLDNSVISEALKQEFNNNGITLVDAASVSVVESGTRWLLTNDADSYTILKQPTTLDVYERSWVDPHPHDLNASGTKVITYAEYGHGTFNSIREIWAEKLGKAVTAIVRADIIGYEVKQGELIMRAGDTGRSAYNHLHMHIKPQISGSVGDYTIPFVFADVEGDGVLKAFRYYQSNNVKYEKP